MKRYVLIVVVLACQTIISQTKLLSERIDILKTYDMDHLHRIALPLGGTGTVSFGGKAICISIRHN